jgi:hypothetical protein
MVDANRQLERARALFAAHATQAAIQPVAAQTIR